MINIETPWLSRNEGIWGMMDDTVRSIRWNGWNGITHLPSFLPPCSILSAFDCAAPLLRLPRSQSVAFRWPPLVSTFLLGDECRETEKERRRAQRRHSIHGGRPWSGKLFDPWCTEPRKSLGTWLWEISSCSCLTFLSGPAWVLLSKIYKPFWGSLYVLLYI